MSNLYTFGEEAAVAIQGTVNDWRRRGGRGRGDRFETPSNDPGITFRIGKTGTNSDHTSYPTTGDTFVVAFGELTWTASPGVQAHTWTAYTPAESVVAHDLNGKYWPQNSYVYLGRQHGVWYIISGAASSRLKAVVAAPGGIAVGGSGLVTVWQSGLATSRQETAHLNWMATATLAVNKKCIIEWFADEGKWVIVQAEC